jgi:cyclophilin family peptidyl-prolyl cis-trans isomerase
VRTEAVRVLGMFPDSAAVVAVLAALDSPDTWLSVSAAEGLARHREQASVTAPRLAATIAPGKSAALQVTALAALNALSPDHALAAATVMARDTSVMVRAAAENSLRMRGAAAPGRAAGGAGARGRGAGGGRGGGRARGPVQTSRSEADYRQIVERWIVPDYNGAARPVAEWVTSRGSFQIELYPGDAPIGVADFFRNVESGALIGVDFSRVVPDFVDQQRGIPGHAVVRDEVSRKRLTRANVSWASAGLDTGRPGYTLGHTPQPHNEGGFTALGRIVRGMDIVDRIELGDRVLSARIVSTGR